MKTKRIIGASLIALALAAGWLLSLPPPHATDRGKDNSVANARGNVIVAGNGKGNPASSGNGNTASGQIARASNDKTGSASKAMRTPGPGVMDDDGRVLPPPRPMITYVHPGMPHDDLKEAVHERGPDFNVGKFRKPNGKVYRD